MQILIQAYNFIYALDKIIEKIQPIIWYMKKSVAITQMCVLGEVL